MKITNNSPNKHTQIYKVDFQNKNIHNSFCLPKSDITQTPHNIAFGRQYEITKNYEYPNEYKIELNPKEAITYFFIGVNTTVKNLINTIFSHQKTDNKRQTQLNTHLTTIGKAIAQKRGLLTHIKGRNKQLSTQEIISLTALQNEEFQNIHKRNLFNIPERKDNQLDAFTICKLAKLNDKKYEKIKNLFYIENLKDKQLTSYEIGYISTCADTLLDNAIALLTSENYIKREMTIFDLLYLSALPSKNIEFTKEFLYISERKDDQFKNNDIYDFIRFSNKTKLNKIRKLVKLQRKTHNGDPKFLNADEIFKLSLLSKKEFINAKTLFYIPERKDNQLSIPDIVNIVRLEKGKREKAKKLLYIPERKDNQLDGEYIPELVEAAEKSTQNIEELLYIKDRKDAQFNAYDIINFLKLDPKAFKNAKKLFYIPERKKHQYTGPEIFRLARLDDKKFEIAQKYLHFKDTLEASATDIIFSVVDAKTKDITKLSYKEKLNHINHLNYIKRITDKKIKQEIGLEDMQNQIFKALNYTSTPINVSSEAKSKFFKDFIVINNPETKEILTNLSPLIEKYGKTGIPLKYPRQQFVKNLVEILSTLPTQEKNNILEKLNIELTQDFKGYNGLLQINNLNSNNQTEKKIKEEAEKFLHHNEVITSDEKVNEKLNILIKAIPEFINIMGKRQHATHKYSVDCHTLKVLEEVLKHKKFETLTPINKIILQIATIFHDFGKSENVVDSGHEIKSAYLATGIIQKFALPINTKDTIIEFIKNHDWFAQYQKTKNSNKIALMFRTIQGLDMAEIFANSDLLGVSEEFHKMIFEKHKLDVEPIKHIQEKFWNNGNILFTTKILDDSKIPIVKHKGEKYKVIDFTKISNEEDLFKYGLSIHKKSEFNVLFHAGNEEILKHLLNSTNESVLCTSLISLNRKKTYYNESVGFMIEGANTNIINSYYENQSSGGQKIFDYFINETFIHKNSYRNYQRIIFTYTLKNKYKIDLTEEEYGELYKKIHNKKYMSQIKDEIINGKLIKKEVIIDGLNSVKENILNENKYNNYHHNEINIYNPKIKGIILLKNSLSNLNKKILDFAKENNLPIFILGEH